MIDPEECIDCTLCEPECPVDAIFSEEEVPAGQESFLALNAELSKEWPVITQRKEPPADADAWKDVAKSSRCSSAERQFAAAAAAAGSSR